MSHRSAAAAAAADVTLFSHPILNGHHLKSSVRSGSVEQHRQQQQQALLLVEKLEKKENPSQAHERWMDESETKKTEAVCVGVCVTNSIE